MKAGVDKHGCLVNLGVVCLASEQFSKALHYFTEAVKLKPKEFKDHTRQGDSYFGLKRYEEAIKSYSTAQAILEPYFKLQPQNQLLLNEILDLRVRLFNL
jgi:tetratricopeptide (TPR) repeat protein